MWQFCSQGVNENWPDDPHNKIKLYLKKEISFTKIKSDCAEVLKCIYLLGSHGKKSGKWMRKGKEEGWLPGFSPQHRRSLTDRFPRGRGGWRKYHKDMEYCLFSTLLTFLPSLESTGFWSKRNFCLSLSEILYIPMLSRDWQIYKKHSSISRKG